MVINVHELLATELSGPHGRLSPRHLLLVESLLRLRLKFGGLVPFFTILDVL